jgi:hypothetical protein
MMKTVTLAMVAATLALAPVAASAGEILKAAPATLDPSKAYLLVTLNDFGRFAPHLAVLISRYDPEARDIRGKPGSSATPLPPGGDAGVVVTANVSIVRDGLARVHLIALEPGDYVIEGAGVESGIRTSYALGSYWMSLKPGVITDLGEGTIGQDGGPNSAMGVALKTAFAVPFSSPKIPAMTVTFKPAERGRSAIGALPYEAVELKPGATFGNYQNGPIFKLDGPSKE